MPCDCIAKRQTPQVTAMIQYVSPSGSASNYKYSQVKESEACDEVSSVIYCVSKTELLSQKQILAIFDLSGTIFAFAHAFLMVAAVTLRKLAAHH